MLLKVTQREAASGAKSAVYDCLIDATRIVCGAGSISNGRMSVRLSVCPTDGQRQRPVAGLLLSALQAEDIDRQLQATAPRTSYRSISPAGARAQNQMRLASC